MSESLDSVMYGVCGCMAWTSGQRLTTHLPHNNDEHYDERREPHAQIKALDAYLLWYNIVPAQRYE